MLSRLLHVRCVRRPGSVRRTLQCVGVLLTLAALTAYGPPALAHGWSSRPVPGRIPAAHVVGAALPAIGGTVKAVSTVAQVGQTGTVPAAPIQSSLHVPASVPAPLRATVGRDIGDRVRTCVRPVTRLTPLRGRDCSAWAQSGPVNVVILRTGAAPPGSAGSIIPVGWRPAAGNWLVADGYVNGGDGCAPGWRDSGAQIELRIDPLSRRHFKAITGGCGQSSAPVVFGEAHTDGYDVARCGGDHLIDLDAARDSLVHALLQRPGATVIYEQNHRHGAVYPSGCGQAVASDGRVAYVTLPA